MADVRPCFRSHPLTTCPQSLLVLPTHYVTRRTHLFGRPVASYMTLLVWSMIVVAHALPVLPVVSGFYYDYAADFAGTGPRHALLQAFYALWFVLSWTGAGIVYYFFVSFRRFLDSGALGGSSSSSSVSAAPGGVGSSNDAEGMQLLPGLRETVRGKITVAVFAALTAMVFVGAAGLVLAIWRIQVLQSAVASIIFLSLTYLLIPVLLAVHHVTFVLEGTRCGVSFCS